MNYQMFLDIVNGDYTQNSELSQDELDALDFLPPSRQNFQVTDEGGAAWVVGKLLDCDDRRARIKAQYDAALKEVDREKAFFEGRFGSQLRDWAASALEGQEKKKSVRLETGTVGFRSISAGLEIEDKDKALEWAADYCPLAVKVETSLLKTPINELFDQTGEVPPGCVHREASEKFTVSRPRGS